MENNKHTRDFNNMLQLAQFGADRQNEKRQVVFRVFIAYMTLLVIISSLIMRHWKDDILVSGWFSLPVIIFLASMFIVYWLWLRELYKSLIFDVRRRDFFLKKAELLCYHSSKDWANKFSFYEKGLLNLASGKSYKITERLLFKKSKPDIEDYIPPQNILEEPCKPSIYSDKHFWFNSCGPAGLTLLIILALGSKSPLALMLSRWGFLFLDALL